jgi:hypothetical protein
MWGGYGAKTLPVGVVGGTPQALGPFRMAAGFVRNRRAWSSAARPVVFRILPGIESHAAQQVLQNKRVQAIVRSASHSNTTSCGPIVHEHLEKYAAATAQAPIPQGATPT